MFKLSALFILVISVCGYLLLYRFPKQRLRLNRTSGYHTFFLSAGAGFALFVAACVIYLLLHWCVSVAQHYYQINLHPLTTIKQVLNIIFLGQATDMYARLVELSSIMLLAILIMPRLFYASSDWKAMFHHAFRHDKDSPEFTDLFYRSFEQGCPILFTLSDRKIYIGYPISFDYAGFNDIRVLPLWGGYRDKDDLKLHLVTPYEQFAETLTEEGIEDAGYQKFAITLPIREIRYARLHDFTHNQQFRQLEQQHWAARPKKQSRWRERRQA